MCLALLAAGWPPAPLVAPLRDWDQKLAAANGCRRGEKLLPPATAENDYQEHHGCGLALAHGQEWAPLGPLAPWRNQSRHHQLEQ